jgi:hypothetical protein
VLTDPKHAATACMSERGRESIPILWYPRPVSRLLSGMSALGVRREKAALSSGCKPHPATAPAGSNRSSYGGNEMAEAFG